MLEQKSFFEKYEKKVKKNKEYIIQQEKKIILENNWFKILILSLCLKFNIFIFEKSIKTVIYKSKVNKIKNHTLKMSGDIWYKNILGNSWKYLVLIIMFLFMVFPFYWMITTAFKSYDEIRPNTKESLWPRDWTLTAFKDLFNYIDSEGKNQNISFSRFFMNSVLVSTISTFGQMTVSLIAGFAIYNWRTKFNKYFYIITFSIMLVPAEALLLGRYTLMFNFQWEDSLAALTIPFIGNIFTIYLMSNAFYNLNPELKKASKIDGLSTFKFFIKIAVPAVSSTIITSLIISFIESWNSVLWPVTILSKNGEWKTLPYLLWSLMSISGADVSNQGFGGVTNPINVKMAASLLIILPMLLILFVFNRPIINGLTRKNGGGNKN